MQVKNQFGEIIGEIWQSAISDRWFIKSEFQFNYHNCKTKEAAIVWLNRRYDPWMISQVGF